MTLALADRMSSVKPSPTVAATARALALKAKGHDILSLTAGEPDFPTPVHVQDAAIAAIRSGQTKYTAVDGTPALKDAIIGKFRRENGLDYAEDEVIAGTGAKQVIFNAILALVGTGDEVVIPTPAWVSYVDMVRLAGGVPVLVPSDAAFGFRPDPEKIADAITPRTRVLMLNSPSNPTGVVLNEAELRSIGSILAQQPQVICIIDDIYEHLIYSDAPFRTLAELCPDLKDRVLTVNGVSKAYAMTGWRIGYAGGPRDLVKAMKTLQSQSTSNPCSIAQAAATAALNGGLDTVREMRAAFQARRDRFAAQLQAIEGMTVTRPEGAFYLFVGIEDLLGRCTPDGQTIETEEDLVEYLLSSASVACVGGAGFGVSPNLRFSFATDDSVLDRAAVAIAASCARLALK